MRYLCLVYHERATADALAERESAALAAETRAFREELRRSGHDVASSPLHRAPAATTIRVRRGEITVTDGPAVETSDELAEFYLVEARDLNDAIRVVARMPPARLGCVEVRPLREPDLGNRAEMFKEVTTRQDQPSRPPNRPPRTSTSTPETGA